MREIESRAVAAYREEFGEEPAVVASAPGRVNLIGEHVDYSGGFVFPCAVDRRIAVAMGRGDGALYSVDYAERRGGAEKDGSWADYPRGVAWALAEAGRTVGPFRAAFAGDVPRAAGLSSSAAIEAATGVALNALFGLDVDGKTMAKLCQRAENAFVGVNCGIMDQYASLLCQEGAALLIDCRSLDAESVPLAIASSGLSLLICDTQVPRTLAGSGYNARRATCEEAAATLGVPLLRDATLADLAKLDGLALKRARHVVSENARVLAAVAALRAADYAEFGRLMYASHASLRDDYEVSTPELDGFVEVAGASGALGARLTGAGFGGCAIALVPSASVPALSEAVQSRFRAAGFPEPVFYQFRPSAGAQVVS